MFEVAEQFVFSVCGLRHDALGFEFRETERWWRTKAGFVFRGEIQIEEEEHMKGQVPKRALPLSGPHRIRAGFDRVGEHVDRGMELLPDCRFPEVNHEALRSAAKSLRNLDTFVKRRTGSAADGHSAGSISDDNHGP